MLTSVLLLLSCSAQKKLTSSTERTLSETHLLQHLDSVVRAELHTEIAAQRDAELESSTDMVVYDTERVDSTGAAPIKAVVSHRTRSGERSQERVGVSSARFADVRSEQDSDSTAEGQHEESEESQRKTDKTPIAWVFILAVSLAAAGCIVYKRKTK